ncbi:MAG TPA: MMPL family transporter [Chloroflexota bacterium]|nr:MMPL family transporter [Chloroflexota bacterium]
MFARWGHFVYRRRRLVLSAALPFLVLALLGFRVGVAPNFNAQPPVEAGRALTLIDRELPKLGNSFVLIFTSRTRQASDPGFRAAMLAALGPLARDPIVDSVETPYNTTAGVARGLISTDGHRALALVSVKGSNRQAIDAYAALRRQVHSATLQIATTGGLAIYHDFNTYLNGDLARTSGAILPIALILLLVVFGTVVAAVLPLGVAALALIAGISGVYLLGLVTDITQYATNLIALIGLGVAIDYSLFIVSRFRHELLAGRSVEESVTIAVATAGRAVAFSGLTVAIGISGMFFYQGVYLATMGLAGAAGILLAVLCALTFLPALLAVLGPRVNRWRVPLVGTGSGETGFWHSLAFWVMQRPVFALIPTLGFLLLVGSPVVAITLANSDIRSLPPQAPSRQTNDVLARSFPGEGQNTIAVVLYYPDGRPLAPRRTAYLYDLTRRIERLPEVRRVRSLLDAIPGASRAAATTLLGEPAGNQPPALRQAIYQYAGTHIVELDVEAHATVQSDAARTLVRTIRSLPSPPSGQHLVTGDTALDIDNISYVESRTPAAVAYIVLVTYVVLFLLVGSLVLPLKAVVMNLLSISASFGALVWIFQQGHLRTQLNFTPQPIDPTTMVLLFCIVFGLSMDYEVFLLTRIQEQYRKGMDTRTAVAVGLARSGRLITGAAAIMVGVFLAFGGLANTVIIKEIGLGLAIAVAMDATIVRGVVVPALMRLLGQINWWAPGPLARAYSRLGLAEQTEAAAEPARSAVREEQAIMS